MQHILAIDQSTSATKTLLFNERAQLIDLESLQHKQYYPQPGWVEHDAEEIWQNLLKVTRVLLERNPKCVDNISGISITNQRETIVVFDKETGKALHPAIVWQCRRSEAICQRHIGDGCEAPVHKKTGLKLDPYFSASKIQWLMQENPELSAKIKSGKALVGTIDSYLVYRLTSTEVFATDSSNASRTLLYNINKLEWDEELCELWQVPRYALPEVKESADFFGKTNFEGLMEKALPIVGVMGDSQASLFAQQCFEAGSAKVTFGTGSSVLLNIGTEPRLSDSGVLTALAWVKKGVPTYAFEGIIINSASTLDWLQKQLQLVSDIDSFERLASQVEDNGGVYLVPAFSGLGLPHWEPGARASIVGLSSHNDRRHVVRAGLESLAYQLRDALDAMQAESGVSLQSINADGGPTANSLLMNFTADITQTHLSVSKTSNCSALGATLMGLLGLGVYSSLESIASNTRDQLQFIPGMPPERAKALHNGWLRAVKQTLAGITQ